MLRSLLGAVVATLIICLAVQPPLAFAGDAMLEVNSQPSGAAVYVDGEKVGTTPGLFDVSSGKRTVTLRKSPYADSSRTVTLGDGDIEVIDIKMSRDAKYLMRAEREELVKAFKSDYRSYTQGKKELENARKKLTPKVVTLNGQSKKQLVSAKTKPYPKQSDHRKKQLKPDGEKVAALLLLGLITSGVCLVGFCIPEMWHKKRYVNDYASYNRAKRSVESYNKKEQARAEAQNREIRAYNESLDRKLAEKNKSIDKKNTKIDRQISKIENKYKFNTLEQRMKANAGKIVELSRKLGDAPRLKNRPTFSDYARAFEKF